MNKAEFLKELHDILAGKLPPEELDDVLSYYEAYFADSEEDEETVAERLGSPASVAEQVLKDAGESARQVSTPPPASAGRRRRAAPLIIAVVIGIILVIFVLPSTLLLALRTDDSLTPTVSESNTPVLVSEDSDLSVELSPFDALELDVAVASVQIRTGSNWSIRLVNQSQDTSEDSYQLNYRNRNGILSVWSTSNPTDVLPDQSSADILVYVTIPEGIALDRAELALGVGSLDWSGCAVSGKLKAETGVGNLDVLASLGVADLSAGVGNVELKLAAPADKADLTAGTGDVTLEITDDQSDYSWQLSTGTGDIRLNGEIMSPFLLTGGDGNKMLSLSSGTGDLSLEFQ